ncbi:MAG: phosphate ABC transporter substrate-binding protein PstS [Nitrososphaerota archaeon]|nr:phosphate ABC transporter substrate-binding protein PstS [Candidatus Bathyarchaeota archaeon]MCX8162726.1 phosphate ABC transporter substrate-binding protein PstS [Candidatus Bathyarchaeota archaeon]MDW8062149.1 phosphate ABC transporter substrate-binding protein PstS [Nitrososphaerota archaeon]
MKSRSKITVAIIILTMIAVSVIAYQTLVSQEEREVSLNGAGATFPFPLIDKWIAEYHKIKLKVLVNYQAIGSGGGIRAHMEKTVHFAATDVPLSDAQFRNATGTLHIPLTIGGVVPIYNLPGVSYSLNFTGEILAKVFLGKITKWNDPSIKTINPGVNLPDKEIIVVHRSDGSGTTFIWTSYLSAISQEWREIVGKGTSVKWPVGLGAKGNDGVAALVQQTPYSIGYVEFTYAKKNNLPYGRIQNAAGEFVEPSIESFRKAAAAAAVALPRGDESWSRVSIVDIIVHNREARGAYPITSFSYIIMYRELSVLPNMDEDTARALVYFLWWCIHDGQSYAADLYYVPLPDEVIRHNEETIKLITFNGRRVYRG